MRRQLHIHRLSITLTALRADTEIGCSQREYRHRFRLFMSIAISDPRGEHGRRSFRCKWMLSWRAFSEASLTSSLARHSLRCQLLAERWNAYGALTSGFRYLAGRSSNSAHRFALPKSNQPSNGPRFVFLFPLASSFLPPNSFGLLINYFFIQKRQIEYKCWIDNWRQIRASLELNLRCDEACSQFFRHIFYNRLLTIDSSNCPFSNRP